jgi:hypothetical protein
MIISPGSAHAAGIDVVGHDVAGFRELFIADTALAVLGPNLLVHQLSRFRIRADLSLPAGMMGIVDAADSQRAQEEQSDKAFMRAPPQRVPIMCSIEVAHPDASRENRDDHFERRPEILC